MSQPGDQSKLPKHLAVVMDGNGRWAKKRFMPRTAGHKAGVKATRTLVEESARRGIEALTIFAFSSENWGRPNEEVDSLMSLFVSTLAAETKKLHQQNIRVRFIGDRSRFNDKLRAAIADAESLTADNSGMRFNIAANYGGRWDIINAVQKLLADGQDITALNEDMLSANMQTADVADVDLFIRTGGEQRISNFLIWQSAYAELYFTDTLWPDFDAVVLERALDWFAGRERRFGKTSQQVSDNAGTG